MQSSYDREFWNVAGGPRTGVLLVVQAIATARTAMPGWSISYPHNLCVETQMPMIALALVRSLLSQHIPRPRDCSFAHRSRHGSKVPAKNSTPAKHVMRSPAWRRKWLRLGARGSERRVAGPLSELRGLFWCPAVSQNSRTFCSTPLPFYMVLAARAPVPKRDEDCSALLLDARAGGVVASSSLIARARSARLPKCSHSHSLSTTFSCAQCRSTTFAFASCDGRQFGLPTEILPLVAKPDSP